ncbi:hypothetical protein [Roseateles noduli]|uniref:hypothetical protein n=1 Tax=Roseateles noduli TaxID=2052484 RepID=UPI003D65467D
MIVNQLILRIDVPDDVPHQTLLGHENIPCICRVDGTGFSVSFVPPLPAMSGFVEGWERQMVELRAPAMGGATVTFNCNGLISLRSMSSGKYSIQKLSFFVEAYPGWFPIVEDGVWATPVSRHTAEDLELLAEIESEIDARRAKKKHKRIQSIDGE